MRQIRKRRRSRKRASGERLLVGLDGFAEAPRQATRADGHGVAAAVGLALELREMREGGEREG